MSYPTVEMLSVYSTASVEWAKFIWRSREIKFGYKGGTSDKTFD